MYTSFKVTGATVTGLVLSVIIGSTCSSIQSHGLRHYFDSMHERTAQMMHEFERMGNSIWNGADKDKESSGDHEKNRVILEAETVSLPDISPEFDKDNQDLVSLQIKGLTGIKKEAIAVNLDEEKNRAQVQFPYKESRVTITIYPPLISNWWIRPGGIRVEAEKAIVQEKKDEKGTVLSTSSYTAYNSNSQSFPNGVNVSSIAASYNDKDGVLTLTFVPHKTKRTITVK